MPDFVKTYCKGCGLKEVFIKESKAGKEYPQNLDYSFHVIPVKNESSGKTEWVHIESKEMEELVKSGTNWTEYELKKPHYTKDQMKKLDKPLTLKTSPAKETSESSATQTKADVIAKFSESALIEVDDKTVLAEWEKCIKGSYLSASKIHKDAIGAEKDERISTQGFMQNFTIFYGNMKLAKSIDKLAEALKKANI